MCFKIINVEVEVCKGIIIGLREKFWYIFRCGWMRALSVCVAGSALALGWRGCSRFLCVCGELDGGGEGGWLVGPFQAGGGLVGCVQSQELCACAPRLLRFILLVSFNETLLVVLILDMVYNCHLRRRLQP